MKYSNNLAGALKAYNQVGVQTDVASASPHRLIQMLMEGALEKIAIAKGHMERGEIANKGAHISWAISIIDGLRMSLDKETGGDLAQNLGALYEYMQRRLAEANIENNVSILDEVASLLREIKTAWDAISERGPLEAEQLRKQSQKEEIPSR
jgi:flagellar protein FliS